MSPTADNVGKIRPTGRVADTDRFFFFRSRAKKCREMATFHSYAKISYRRVHLPKEQHLYTNTQQPTRATVTLLPSAFPSSLSVGAAAAPSNHGAAAPQRHAQAASRRDSVGVVGSIAGEGKKRGIEK
jgi:hypothetical protein